MKILILTNSDEGVYRFRKELLIKLMEKHNEVLVCSIPGKYLQSIIDLGCKYLPIEFERKGTNPLKDLKLLKNYYGIIKKENPDVVLTYNIKSNVYGGLACQACKVPYISTVAGLGSAVENAGLLQIISLFLYRIGLRKCYRVFFQNKANKEFMINHRVARKDNAVLVTGSGVNLDMYKLLPFPSDKEIGFAYIGRIMKEKGIDLYLEVAKQIHDKYPNTKFNVCGMYEEDYKEIIDDLVKQGVIEYHGNVTDMINVIYKNIQCTIHPSYYAEGMSNVLLESAASGRAVITTDKHGCIETVDDEVSGYVVKQKSLPDLIEKVEEFINLTNAQRKQMGLNGRKKVENEFDRNIVIDKYIEEIYNANK